MMRAILLRLLSAGFLGVWVGVIPGAFAQTGATKPPFALNLLVQQPTHTFVCNPTSGLANLQGCILASYFNWSGATLGINTMVGDSGSGGAVGLVPAPSAGDAAAGKYLSAAGNYSVPAGGGGGGSLSGMTVGQLGVAGSASSITSSQAFSATPGAGVIPLADGAAHLNNGWLAAIPNTALANSAITIAGVSTALGGSRPIAVGDLTGIVTGTFVGNISGVTNPPSALTATQVTANLNACTTTLKGLVPAPPNDATQFLGGDCAFHVPAVSTPKTINRITTGTANTLSAPLTFDFTTQIWASATAGTKTQTIPSCAAGALDGKYVIVVDAQGTAGVNPIDVHVAAGTIGPSGLDFNLTQNGAAATFQCDGAATAWRLLEMGAQGASARSVSITSDTILATDNGNIVKYSSASAITVTLPDIAGAFTAGAFQVTLFSTGTGAVTINRTSASTINGGTSLFVAPRQAVSISADNTGNNYTAVVMGNRIRAVEGTWVTGQNLSAATHGIPLDVTSQAWTIDSITCTPEDLVGGVATINVYIAPSGTALSAGTLITTSSCTAGNGATVATNQSPAFTVTAVPAGYRIGILAAGAGWAASVGTGVITINLR